MAETKPDVYHGPNVQLLPWLKPSWLPKISIAPAPEGYGLIKPCLLWHGGKSMDGYGLLRMDGRMQYLHRRAWEYENEEPLGKTRDGHHKCYRRNCFEAEHIGALTPEQNRGATWFVPKCPVPDHELVALYDLNAYYLQNGGYA